MGTKAPANLEPKSSELWMTLQAEVKTTHLLGPVLSSVDCHLDFSSSYRSRSSEALEQTVQLWWHFLQITLAER